MFLSTKLNNDNARVFVWWCTNNVAYMYICEYTFTTCSTQITVLKYNVPVAKAHSYKRGQTVHSKCFNGESRKQIIVWQIPLTYKGVSIMSSITALHCQCSDLLSLQKM